MTLIRNALAFALLAAAGAAYAETVLTPANQAEAVQAEPLQPAAPAGKAAPATANAPAANDGFTIDSKQEVAYQCKVGNETVKLTAMYGIKGGDIVVAQVRVNNNARNTSPGLFRVADNMVNRFVSQGRDGTMWTTLPATPETLRHTDGGILSYKQNGSNTVIAEKCKLDKAATAKLGR